MDIKVIIEILSAALTPVIAIVAVYIAFQQWKINKSRFNHELYGRRIIVFKAVMTFFAEIMREGTSSYKMTTKFYADTGEADFFFENEIRVHIEKLYENGIKLARLNEKMYPSSGGHGLPVGKERTQVANEHDRLLGWFIDELPRTKALFKKYLKLK